MAKDTAPEPLDPNFQLSLPKFEGPLDLLLHLVQQHELEILDLPISFVTERYLAYLKVMQRLDLDVAAEYLVMAATLAYIKSKMLLPPDPSLVDDESTNPEEEIDPRAELIRRLLEYQKYKAAGAELASRGLAGRDVFFRGTEPEEASGPAPLAEIGLFKLLDAFQAVLKRANKELALQVTSEGIGIQERVSEIIAMLAARRTCRFDELFENQNSLYDLVVTFLAILEMGKRRLARIYQPGALEPIHLEYRILDEAGEGAGPSANDDDTIEPTIARPGEDPLGEAEGEPELDDQDDEDDAQLEAAAAAEQAEEDRSISLDGLESDGEDEHHPAPAAGQIIERAGGDGEEE
jgi:segregation and condensation protein A